MTTCSLGGDGVANPGDTCSFSCNTGYEITGSVMRTCQNDGSWSGSDSMCSRGEHHSKNVYKYAIIRNSILT